MAGKCMYSKGRPKAKTGSKTVAKKMDAYKRKGVVKKGKK